MRLIDLVDAKSNKPWSYAWLLAHAVAEEHGPVLGQMIEDVYISLQ